MRRMKRAALAIVLLASCRDASHAYDAGSATDARAIVQTTPRAPIVVGIVVDQLAAWVLSERAPLLPKDGGFARLMREGTYVREVRFAHATCDTAPGHAALYTGAPPHESGIDANETLDDDFEKVSFLADPKTTQIDAFSVRDGETSSSLARLRVPTVADALRAAKPDAVIVSLSLKDRGAIFGGGKNPTDVVWYDAAKGNFVTSSAFARAPTPWLKDSFFEDQKPYVDKVWDAPLHPDWVRAHSPTPDAQRGEGDYLGLKSTYPHALLEASSPMKALRMTPFADHVLLAMGLRALDARRAQDHETLLAISLSANDYIGHTFGPDSWEAWDELDRLDTELAIFMRALDARYGPSGYAIVLAADHGVVGMPETATLAHACGDADRWTRPCEAGERIMPRDLTNELRDAATRALGPSPTKKPWVAGIAEPYVLLTERARTLSRADHAKLVRAVEDALRAHRGVERVYESAPATCAPESDESLDALVCRARSPRDDEALYVLLKPGSFFDAGYAEGAGTSHGSPYLFDRAIPTIARAPGRVAAGRVIDTPTSYRVFAKTLADLLQVPAPAAVTDAASLASVDAR